MGLDGHFGEDSTFGDAELKKTEGCFTYRSGSTAMSYGEYASTFDMPKLCNGL
uniref:Uncharacterized protein n=1 Tax=Brassica oleracea TaxID=3712 RepID=A0A3P6GN41_BRAOL|nr:unnamed protein product [Brassica oleracea]